MNTIPTPEDWANDPAGALAAATALAKTTMDDGDVTSQAIAWGIAAQILATAAPIAGQALAGPLGGAGGALAGAAIQDLAASLSSQRAGALAALPPEQQALVPTAVTTGAALAQAKLVKP